MEEPRYDQLPIDASRAPGSSWGVWGDDDVFGCLNRLRPDRVREAAHLVVTGDVFAVNLEISMPDPPLFRRAAVTHTVTGPPDGPGHDDVLEHWNTQSSSQWDGFLHIRNMAHGLYNGLAAERHGIHHWARRGLAGRAVLADVARWREQQGRRIDPAGGEPISVGELEQCLKSCGTSVLPGDLLLVRTGWLGWYRERAPKERSAIAEQLRAPGLEASEETARWLWDSGFAAVAADNPALEAWPPPGIGSALEPEVVGDPARAAGAFLHTSLLPLLGMPIGELWDLDAFAEACAADGRYVALFTSAPLAIPGGVASPPNALLIR